MSHSLEFLALIEEARPRVKRTDVYRADESLRRNPDAILVDIREDHEWEREHVKGAVHIGKGVIERDIVDRVPEKDREILLYCGGGYRSVLAADNLQKMGYTNVWSVDGGYRGFRAAGKEMESGAGT
jgi:rhodanese-related sulfurtransferase